MPIQVKLPEIGEGIESGDVLEVLVHQGDIIEKDQDIVELETQKATTGVPSPHAGKVIKVHVREGDTIAVGTTIITIEAVESTTRPSIQTTQPEAESEPEPAPTQAKTAQRAHPAAPANEVPQRPSTTTEDVAESAKDDASEFAAGPAIRRFAREVGVDLARVTGTGESGRITREDVLAVVRQASQSARLETSDSTERDPWGPIHTERLSKIRQTIAAKMHESWTTAPRVTNFDDADVTDLEDFRQSSKADYAAKGIKLTSLPFVIKAVAMSLKSHPEINATLDLKNVRILYKQYINIGIAVDTERGLVVPSLRGADDLSISEIAQTLAELAERVRNKNFSLDDLRGSTFTISNLGAIGGTYSTPMINVPEVAILLVGRARKMPVVVDDDVAIRLMMPLSLSYDHRLVDGAMAARFLNEVGGFLKAPSRLLLAP